MFPTRRPFLTSTTRLITTTQRASRLWRSWMTLRLSSLSSSSSSSSSSSNKWTETATSATSTPQHDKQVAHNSMHDKRYQKDQFSFLQQEILKYTNTDSNNSIQNSFTPPSTWYTSRDFFSLDREHVLLNHWTAVDVWTPTGKGAYKTGYFMGQPYLLTTSHDDNDSSSDNGEIQAFFNVCTHAGSCLAGPWTKHARNQGDTASCSSLDLNPSLVGQASEGQLSPGEHFQCPYHGWRFNTNGRLTRATQTKGIQSFQAKDFALKPIPVRRIGPIVFLNFGGFNSHTNDGARGSDSVTRFDQSRDLLFDRLERNGFVADLSDLKFVESRAYTLKCNWKVFTDNYGDGCYHCSYAHADLASNIDETSYSTNLLSDILSIQQAPPSSAANDDERFGNKTAVYAQWYPNLMLNRYGPWFDIDLVIPIDESTTKVLKFWFLERDFQVPSDSYIQDSIQSSERVHDEDVFLCENVQLGLQSRGFQAGRYVPSKQIATHHFHQELAKDYLQACGVLDSEDMSE
ncbi:hypothetical protein ACA910_014701 [Epithemia clementina (nom. ined.)]